MDEERKIVENDLFLAVDLLHSQPSDINPVWFAKFRERGNHLFKFVKDNIRDETRHTLPKTNERDRHNQPLPANVIGRHFGTFRRHDYTAQ